MRIYASYFSLRSVLIWELHVIYDFMHSRQCRKHKINTMLMLACPGCGIGMGEWENFVNTLREFFLEKLKDFLR